MGTGRQADPGGKREQAKADRWHGIEQGCTHEGPLAAGLRSPSRKEVPELGQLREKGPSHRVELVSRIFMPRRPRAWKVWASALEWPLGH